MGNPRIEIGIGDVIRAGGVEQAIIAAAEGDDQLLLATAHHAMGGQTFATSGPGPGWSVDFDAGDYARQAIEYDLSESGADESCDCIDPENGRVAVGRRDGDEIAIEWTDESRVAIECPSVEDAIDDPEAAASMAKAVINLHGDCSGRAEWLELVASIREAAAAMEGIDLDDLDD